MVAARTREIGLRMAIGADRRDVASLIVVRAAALVLSGLAIGTAIALFAARSLSATGWWRPLLFGVSWFEPRTYSIIVLILGVVSCAACFVPVWRATRVDPMRVLRDE
jgi:ABC-type antimicrobial peptide transport system permease subunit